MANVHIQPMDDGLLNVLPTQQDTKTAPDLHRNRPGIEEDKPPQAPKRKTAHEVFTRQEETETKKAKTEGELFPNIEQKPLPEKAEEAVNFNSNFLHKKAEKQQETSKPTLAQPDWNPGEVKGAPGDKIALTSHRDQPQTEAKTEQSQKANKRHNRNEPLIDFSRRVEASPEEYTAFEKKLLGTASGIPLQVANAISQHRMEEQVDSLDAFRAMTDKIRNIQAKQREILEEMSKNTELKHWWTSLKDAASYLSAGVGLIMGTGVALSGGGILPLLGGIGSLGSLYLKKNGYNQEAANALSVLSLIFTGKGALDILPEGLITATSGMQAFGQLSQGVSSYQVGKTQTKQYEVQSEYNEIKFTQDKYRSKKSKALGGIKTSDSIDVLNAVAKSNARENQLKESIARMLSSAA